MPRRRRRSLPPEAAATLLALSTIPFGAATGLPTWGIFLRWAAASMYADGSKGSLKTLGRCLITGAVFAATTLYAQSALGQRAPGWLIALAVLALANPAMILLSRNTGQRWGPGDTPRREDFHRRAVR